MRLHERGDTLLEVIVAAGLFAVTIAVVAGGSIVAAHQFGPQTQRSALRHYLQAETHIAADVLKYQGAAIVPRVTATTVPIPGAAPLPVHVSIDVSAGPAGGIALMLRAWSDADPNTDATLQTLLADPAPLPYARIRPGRLVPAPSAAQ